MLTARTVLRPEETGSGSISAVDTAVVIGFGTISNATPAANSASEFSVGNLSTVDATVTGTWVGNISFEATSNGTHWFTVNVTQPGVVALKWYASAPGVFRLSVAGFVKVRIRAAAAQFTSLTSATVEWSGSAASNIVSTQDAVIVQGPAGSGGVLTGNPVLIAGTDGAKVRVPGVMDGLLATMTAPMGAIIGVAGSGAGVVLAKTALAITSGTEAAVRATAYLERSAGSQWSIKSSSIADTSAGTGARTVRITYYTLSAGVVAGPFTEDKTLNGLRAVNMAATNACFLEKVEVLTAGSGGVNAGILSLFDAAGGLGTNFASVGAGDRQTLYAHHYVASNVMCMLQFVTASSTTATGNVPQFKFRYRDPTNSANAERWLIASLDVQGSTGAKTHEFATPLAVMGPAVITGYVVPDNSGAQTTKLSFGWVET